MSLATAPCLRITLAYGVRSLTRPNIYSVVLVPTSKLGADSPPGNETFPHVYSSLECLEAVNKTITSTSF